MNWWVVLEIVVGSLISIGFVMWTEVLQKPKLNVKIVPAVDATYHDRPAIKARVLSLAVENKKLSWFARWMSRDPAVRSYGSIKFYHLDGQEVFGRSMPILWANQPGMQLFPDGRLEAYDFHSVKHIDVHAGYSEAGCSSKIRR